MADNAAAPGTVNNAPGACQKTTITAIADTGAQSDLWSLDQYLAAGFPRDKLRPVLLNLSAANRSPIKIEGAFFATLSTTSSDGKVTSCRSMVYVSSCVKSMYLSYDSLLNLGLLPSNFPSSDNHTTGEDNPLDTASHAPLEMPSVNYIRSLGDGCSTQKSRRDAPCSCPQRIAPPLRPQALPFPCTPENNSKMKAWLLQRYSSSTSNTSPHRALPCMDGPPVEIHVDESATPKACHTPANIPLHWQQKVHDDLVRDEALGVIEKVPYGEPVTWCHRMVVTRKHDGSPRRTVDLSPLKKYCKRETFASESPFQLARRIPKNTWKTVTDAWNGYHSVPLRISDRHLTTFITRAPQGFLSSGDGFNRRFDAVLSDFERKERCVDDTIHYDTDLEAHWWRTIHFLTRVGQSGIVLNPDKFQFAEQSVDFAGFRVSDTTIEPLPKYLDAIRNFPRPESTTDIRSWFGLVNQVTNYAQLRDMMAPFKPFLSPRCKFTWSPELEAAFLQSKEAIVEAIHEGVEIFDMDRRTCLRPDWSRRGIGYFLLQKHCSCPSGTPDCCNDGWPITLAGSRFLSPAEQRYAAIEGEALAVAWGLEQTRYFTQGCDNLVVATDHKPLLKILGDRTLDEITNSRLFRLKQRTLPWRFDITHLPGTSNQAADATSRHPASTPTTDSDKVKNLNEHDHVESALMASIQSDAQDCFLRAMLQLRNTPDSDCDLSPAQIIFGRPLRDSFTFVNKLEKYSNPYIRPLWRDAWAAKEQALRTRLTRTTESLMAHSRPLRPLTTGERVFIQNQTGPHPTKWDRSGKVMEHLGNDQYQVKVDGSGRLTLRNRRFLRAYTPVPPAISQIPTTATPSPTVEPPPSNRYNDRQTDVTDPPATSTPNRTPNTDCQPSISPDIPSPPAVHNMEPQSALRAPPPQDRPRPQRARKAPKRYEPESGTWVEA